MNRCRKCNIVIGTPGLTAYCEYISSVADTLKLFITSDTLNEICHHTNAEGSSQIPNLWKDIGSEQRFAFLSLCIFSGVLRTRKKPLANPWTTNASYAKPIFVQQWHGIISFKFYMLFISMTKLQETNLHLPFTRWC